MKTRVSYVFAVRVALLWLLFTSFHATAQIRMEPPPPPRKVTTEEEKAREQTRWMNKNLELELDQFMKVNNINLTYARRLDSLNKVPETKIKSDFKQKMKLSKEAELKAVLTEVQFKQYQQHKDKPNVQKKSPFSGTY